MPLEWRRIQLSLNYWVHLKGHNEDYPAQDVLKQFREKKQNKKFWMDNWAESKRCIQIYTDASKNTANKIGISFIVPV